MVSFLLSALSLLCVALDAQVHACKVVDWENMSVQKRIDLTDIVVIGYDLDHVEVNETGQMVRQDMKFMVECVLKGDGKPVAEEIMVEMIYPLNSCQANQKLEVGNRYIQGLKRTESGNYRWHQVNAMQETVWLFNEEILDTILEVCSVEPSLPEGMDPGMRERCPKVTDDKNCAPVNSCKEPDWEDMSVQKRIGLTDIVVIGYDKDHVVVNETGQMVRQDMKFMVECVLKSDGQPVAENIVVEMIEPLTSCHDNQKVEVGNRYIQGLTRTESGNYIWHLVNVNQETVWPFNQTILDTIMEECSIVPALPNGTDPSMQDQCPKVKVDNRDCARVGGLHDSGVAIHASVLVALEIVVLLMSLV